MRRLTLLCCAAALGGCGLLIDPVQGTDAGNPPAGMDAGSTDAGSTDAGSTDAGSTDAGPAAECELDEECDDGLRCNGLETCSFGECRAGTPIVCDDGIGCTTDECDEELGGCVHTANDDMCPEPALECAVSYCDPEVGCRRELLDTLCDDSIHCTADRCTRTGCENQALDRECPDGEYCQPDADAGPAPGCRPIPTCLADGDCPPRVCNGAPRCDGGACVYSPIVNDSRCYSADECVPVGCDEGRCVIGPRVTCPSTGAATCTRPVCVRSESGDVTCASEPRDGEACTPTTPCHSGVCAGNACVETALCTATPDPCETPICDATGGCGTVRNTCGTNSSCDSTDGSCTCDPGWRMCNATDLDCGCAVMATDAGTAPLDAGRPDAGGRDAGGPTVEYDGGSTTACLINEVDCDGDGMCECVTDRSRCSMGECVCLLDCPLATRCCPLLDGALGCWSETLPCPVGTP